ncbi:helix-turn-helix domain-containing protein [Riemerella anatipestifer]|uniref:helix-turn-helix domain-containing protein n=1 Tax=Riemerella anatipestifer TaxID=34085 RepID=UPI001BDB2215|nr:helix-turn-helix transcriptional regulator [Riemerella anatipestifer]MBT0551606.1 helix-turn-helix transcriptional regulator [Riemerella anatipestifer]MBT0552709.1 helix-turn-helix transcriptional regulator [Riemerella anatipestifer]MCE3023447.1 helix-turn-helix transcriptional regulator [Riemerella anatipestifer]MCU7558968.1 helix-turn-helix transcriptional regulator [Riemerella anatipestifer]MDY3448111.1 helix-turn-helix transcriptional regulator [Riemerella anatipestifer]
MQTLIDRLNFLLHQHGLTRYALSKKTGISEATLSRIILHNVKPNTITVRKIADFFNVSEQWLLTGVEEPSIKPRVIYDVITYDYLEQGDQARYLNQKSKEGWELVSATYMIDTDGTKCMRFFFKKELE